MIEDAAESLGATYKGVQTGTFGIYNCISFNGNKIITVRIREDILAGLDRLANESNYSRNELINIILDYGVKNIEIQ